MANYKDIEEFYNAYIKIQDIKRAGWVNNNVPAERIESVSDHTLQVIMLAMTLNYELKLGFDISDLVQMCFIHDIGETIIGDISDLDINNKNKKGFEKEAVREVLSSLSEATAEKYYDYWIEMEECNTPLAKFAFQVDKIDAILKAKKYSNEYNMPELFKEFCETRKSRGTFTSGPLKEMFEALEVD